MDDQAKAAHSAVADLVPTPTNDTSVVPAQIGNDDKADSTVDKPADPSSGTGTNQLELCATLHKSLKNGDRCIALVVRAKDHTAAKAFADEQIFKIVAEIDQNALDAKSQAEAAKAATKKQAEAAKAATSETAKAAKAAGGEDPPKGEDPPELAAPIYTPEAMMIIIQSKMKHSPLGGGGAAGNNTHSMKRRFEENYAGLMKLSKPTTWLVLHHLKPITGLIPSEMESYYTDQASNQNKTVFVVRSELFWLPSVNKSDPPSQQTGPIIVCSIPASYINTETKYQHPKYKDHYKDAFMQIEAFITQSGEAIERVALAYPSDLYDLHMAASTKKKSAAVKKQQQTQLQATINQSKPKAAQKKSKPKKVGQSAKKSAHLPTGSSSGSVTESESGAESDDEHDPSFGRDSDLEVEEMSQHWLQVVDDFKTRNDIIVCLMSSKKPGYQAPSSVIDYFEALECIVREFPTCVEAVEDDESNEPSKLSLPQVRKTLFVCDRHVGKYVGNDNDDTTCGGSFGKWVPMHYTSTKIDTKYANHPEFNSLVTFIESPAPPT